MYLTDDDTLEGIYPYVYIAKVQTHVMDNPTYKDIIRVDDEERRLWDDSMVKELKSLAELGSFELINRPRGDNVLQSIWAFRKKR